MEFVTTLHRSDLCAELCLEKRSLAKQICLDISTLQMETRTHYLKRNVLEKQSEELTNCVLD